MKKLIALAACVALLTFPSPASGAQLTFPSIQDGASFRVPQGTRQRRLQFSDALTLVRGSHTLNVGGEAQRVLGDFDLRVFQQGRIEFIEDFPDFDRNGDGRGRRLRLRRPARLPVRRARDVLRVK